MGSRLDEAAVSGGRTLWLDLSAPQRVADLTLDPSKPPKDAVAPDVLRRLGV